MNNSNNNPNKKTRIWKLLFLLLIPLAVLIRKVLSLNPEFTEMHYSRSVYKYIMQPISIVTGVFPFSVAELMVIVLILFISLRIIFLSIKAIKLRKVSLFLPFVLNIIMVGSLWFFIQVVVWNINYERLPFSELSGINVEESSIDELEALCVWQIEVTNELRGQVFEGENQIMQMPGSYQSIFERAQEGYTVLEEKFPFLKGRYGRAKPLLFSSLMSHLNFTGIYSCLTGEANINIDAPQMSLAATTMHEMAHQRGFAREDEANYIAYLACMAHSDVNFKYSGSSMALQYCMNALYAEDPDKYFKLVESYSHAYSRDLMDRQAYWQQFQGKTQQLATKMNDTYLKLNGQQDGVKSYGRMVDLLLAEYKSSIEKEV